MLHTLIAFLHAEENACLQPCHGPALNAFTKKLTSMELRLDNLQSNIHDLEPVIAPFDCVYKLITRRSAAENSAEPFWAYMLIDSALLDALEYLVNSKDDSSALAVLNRLDYAIVVGGARGEHLAWIHRVVEHIERTSSWLQKCSQSAADISQTKGGVIGTNISAEPNICFPVERYNVDNVDLERFSQMIVDADSSRPFIIEGAMEFWPALTTRNWNNSEYLCRAVGSHRLVPIEIGAKYTDKKWTQIMMPFGEFIDSLIHGHGGSDGNRGYLAQHNLLDQAPRLKRDFYLPDYALVETGRRIVPNTYTANADGVIVNVWLGPRGTVSPLHFDEHDNLFAQVVGHKYFRMYSPNETHNLYPHPSESLLSNTSQIDAELADTDRFPCAANAKYVECMVKPGDMLYIPPKWWHYVRSLSSSASISVWF